MNPTPNTAIVRYEPRGTGDEQGNGSANNFRYIEETDSFYVEGLAFDGDQPTGTPYTRCEVAPGLPLALGTGFAAYEGPLSVPDFLTDDPINQFPHRAVYGVSTSGRTELAIVRTGAYVGYGFGGFVYRRNDGDGVVLPTLPKQGQATNSGPYPGLRDFNGSGGLKYVTGSARMNIDFDGFSGNCTAARCADAVRLEVADRRIFNTSGANITDAVLGAINTENDASLTDLPVLRFTIGPNVLDANGEMRGTLDSTFFTGRRNTL